MGIVIGIALTAAFIILDIVLLCSFAFFAEDNISK